MKEYHKIQTIFKRNNKGNLIVGKYSRPEIEMLKDINWVWTEKIDGTNIRVIWDGIDKIEFKGRTDKAQIPQNLLNKLEQIFTPNKMKNVFGNKEVCLYGEGYGHKIQKKGHLYNPSDNDFILFDVKIGNWWIKREDLEGMASALNIDIVPIVGNGSVYEAIDFVKQGFLSKISYSEQIAEGLILKPFYDLFDRRGVRIVTKIKHKDFK